MHTKLHITRTGSKRLLRSVRFADPSPQQAILPTSRSYHRYVGRYQISSEDCVRETKSQIRHNSIINDDRLVNNSLECRV
jgi:hypothetical protein